MEKIRSCHIWALLSMRITVSLEWILSREETVEINLVSPSSVSVTVPFPRNVPLICLLMLVEPIPATRVHAVRTRPHGLETLL